MTGPRPLLLALLSSVLLVVLTLALVLPSTIKFKPPQLIQPSTFQLQPLEITPPNPTPTAEPCSPPAKATRNPKTDAEKPGPYHNWEHFNADYNEMMQNLNIYTYPDVHKKSSPFSNIFLPQPDAKKLGNYYSEHAFKTALLSSPLLTSRPEEAQFFYMPFSINLMRLDRRLHSAKSIKKFVARYADRISSEFAFWNASGGADHLYVCCHSIGRDAASNHEGLRNSAIQVTCSSSYFQRLYVSHKDVTLPQVWPRPDLDRASTNPPDKRYMVLPVTRVLCVELCGSNPRLHLLGRQGAALSLLKSSADTQPPPKSSSACFGVNEGRLCGKSVSNEQGLLWL